MIYDLWKNDEDFHRWHTIHANDVTKSHRVFRTRSLGSTIRKSNFCRVVRRCVRRLKIQIPRDDRRHSRKRSPPVECPAMCSQESVRKNGGKKVKGRGGWYTCGRDWHRSFVTRIPWLYDIFSDVCFLYFYRAQSACCCLTLLLFFRKCRIGITRRSSAL